MMLYEGRKSINDADGGGGKNIYKGRAESMLVSPSDSYSELDSISVGIRAESNGLYLFFSLIFISFYFSFILYFRTQS